MTHHQRPGSSQLYSVYPSRSTTVHPLSSFEYSMCIHLPRPKYIEAILARLAPRVTLRRRSGSKRQPQAACQLPSTHVQLKGARRQRRELVCNQVPVQHASDSPLSDAGLTHTNSFTGCTPQIIAHTFDLYSQFSQARHIHKRPIFNEFDGL